MKTHQIFLHGLGQAPSSWEKITTLLHHEINYSCPDIWELMQGRNADYQNMYEAFSQYCSRFSEPLDICGLSLGAVLALHYGAENPKKVHSLILIAPQYRMPKKLLAFQNAVFRFMPDCMFRQTGIEKDAFISLTKSMMHLDFSGSLNDVACPVLVICGEKDHANKKAAEELASRLLFGKYCVVKKAGHEVNIDAPEQLAEIINNFAKKQEP